MTTNKELLNKNIQLQKELELYKAKIKFYEEAFVINSKQDIAHLRRKNQKELNSFLIEADFKKILDVVNNSSLLSAESQQDLSSIISLYNFTLFKKNDIPKSLEQIKKQTSSSINLSLLAEYIQFLTLVYSTINISEDK